MTKEDLRQHLLSGQNQLCSEEKLKSWFDPLIITYTDAAQKLVVLFPHSFFKSWFSSTFQTLFEENVRTLFGKNTSFLYKSSTSQPKKNILPRNIPALNEPPEAQIEKKTLETFIFNNKSSWIFSALHNVIENATQGHKKNTVDTTPHILLLFGAQATGKTHILRATNEKLKEHRNINTQYTSINDLAALFEKEHSFVAYREKLQAYHVILIDDFQNISLYPNLQTELQILLDYYLDTQKYIFIAGTDHPTTWSVPQKLYSRLELGIWAQLPNPDLDIRLRYAQQVLKKNLQSQPKEHLLLIAQHCQNTRCISGTIQRIITHKELLGRELSEKDVLAIIKQTGAVSTISPQTIIMLVSETFGLPSEDLLGEQRKKELVLARQTAMYLCRELLGYSYPTIGQFFGGKDHTTVLHSVKKIKELQNSNKVIHTMVQELLKKCQKSNEVLV